MKRFTAIILCICLLVAPFSVYAEDSQETLNITAEQTKEIARTEVTEQTAVGLTETEDEEWRQLALNKIRQKHGDSASPKSQASGLVSGGIYNIRNMDSGKYLNVHYGVDANGTNVYQWSYDGSTEQKFKVVYSSSTDSYKIYAMCSSNGTNRVIDIARNGSPLASGQNVEIWTPVDNIAQQLQIEYLNHNYYVMRMKANTSMFIAVNGTSNGTGSGTSSTSAGNVYIDTYDVFRSQEWAFELVSHPTAVDPTGEFEAVSDWGVSGWAWRSDDPSIDVDIRIYLTHNTTGEQHVLMTKAEHYRESIASMPYANHAFALQINWSAFPAGAYTVNIYAVNATGNLVLLSGSPKTYGVSNEDYIGALDLNVGHYSNLVAGKTQIYTFIPPQTDYYNIFTTSSIDTYGKLYYNGSQIAFDDDSGDNYNFKIQYLLQEGKTYSIYVKGYTTGTNGAYTVKIESAFLDKLEELQNLAKEYSSIRNSFELTMQYIRRNVYCGTKWTAAAGAIDSSFVSYVNTHNSELAQYFTIVDEFYWYAPNGDIIDIPHLAATYNVYSYNSFDLLGNIFIYEAYINCLGGWAGDLRSLVPIILRDANYTSDYNILYNKTFELVGAPGKFSNADLLADVDAFNIWNIVNEWDNNSLKSIFTEYYLNGGTNTRYTDFIVDVSNYDFYSTAMIVMTDEGVELVWPIKKVDNEGKETDETLNVSLIQYDAICQAFTDYIWQRKGAEYV